MRPGRRGRTRPSGRRSALRGVLGVVRDELLQERVAAVQVEVERIRRGAGRVERVRQGRRDLPGDVTPFLLLHRDAQEDLVALRLVVPLDGDDLDVRGLDDLADLVLVRRLRERVDDLGAAREVDPEVRTALGDERDRADDDREDRQRDADPLDLQEVDVRVVEETHAILRFRWTGSRRAPSARRSGRTGGATRRPK